MNHSSNLTVKRSRRDFTKAGFYNFLILLCRLFVYKIKGCTIKSLSPDGDGQTVWPEMSVEPGDRHIQKNRYSALIAGSSQLERILRSHGITNILITGTKTDVCCEGTARDAMMLDFNVVMVSDCLAALSDDEHRAALETVIQNFGDVMTTAEVLSVLTQISNTEAA